MQADRLLRTGGRARPHRVPLIRQWQADGLVAAGAEPDAVAQLILAIWLGFVAQRSPAGDAEV